MQVLMVAGKFDTAKTLALIEKLLARLQNQRAVRKTWTREQARDGVREVTVRRVTDQQMAAVCIQPLQVATKMQPLWQHLAIFWARLQMVVCPKQLVESKQAVNIGNITFQLAEPVMQCNWP